MTGSDKTSRASSLDERQPDGLFRNLSLDGEGGNSSSMRKTKTWSVFISSTASYRCPNHAPPNDSNGCECRRDARRDPVSTYPPMNSAAVHAT